MSKGLGRNQKRQRELNKLEILGFFEKEGPHTHSSTRRKLRIDKRSFLNAIEELVKDEKTTYSKIKHLSDKRQRNDFYFEYPPLAKTTLVLWYEKYWKKFKPDYYYGIKKNIPMVVQIWHKTKILEIEFQKLKKINRKRLSRNSRESLLKFQEEKELFVADSLWQNFILNDYSKHFEQFESGNIFLMVLLIEHIDRMFARLRDITKFNIRNESGLNDHQKYLIVRRLIESSTIGKVAKDFSVTTKTIAKIKKEFFNQNGTLKSEKINQLIEKNLGVINVHIGEELEKKRKKLNRY